MTPEAARLSAEINSALAPVYSKTNVWPDPASINIVGRGSKQKYQTPDGDFGRVTSILKMLGTSTEALVRWSAGSEREAVLAAVADVYATGSHDGGPAGFVAAVEARIGKAKAHQQIMNKAADIGTSIHAEINRRLRIELGQPAPPAMELSDPAQVAVMSFEDWWRAAGLRAVRTEQPVWSAELRAAGTCDLIVDHPTRGLGLIDFKSSKGVYESMHVQVAAYKAMASAWAPIQWAEIVRFPKSLADPQFEVVPLGRVYGGRVVSEADLLAVFRAAVTMYEVLVA